MKTIAPKNLNVITAIADFLSSDFLQEEIQNLPTELQELFDMVLDTEYGNSLATRRKMLRIKEITTNFAKALALYTEDEIQESYKNH
jgi:hypothetical protein